jgi:tRNA pseudouridine38-40 synthase
VKKNNYFYLIQIQYLGYRYHGWAKQPEVKTVHHMIDRTLTFVLGHESFKTLGSGRTDAMVSANQAAFELFVDDPIDLTTFIEEFNQNLPFDIRATNIEKVDENFNIIQTPKLKEYAYLFCFGEKPHPFTAPLLAWFPGELNLELMQQGARLFEGEHDFANYCKKPTAKTKTLRSVELSEINKNELISASFFPQETFAYHVHGNGFMRNQIRIMMAELIRLGRHEVGLSQIEDSLNKQIEGRVIDVAPASGLHLHQLNIDSNS